MKLLLRITSLIAFAAVTFSFTAQSALAEPENPIVRGSLNVQVVGGGKVTGTGIDCGSDCAHNEAWADNEMAPINRLTAVPNTGWGLLNWSGCSVVTGQSNRCDASYGTEEPTSVVARFIDVQAPSVFIAGYSHLASSTMYLNVTTSDNDQVARVDYLLNGEVVGSKTSDYFNSEIDVSDVPEGVYQLQVRSYDRSGNNGITVAYDLTVDRTGPDVTLNSPVAATRDAAPQFSFGSTAADYWSAKCAIQKKGETDETTWCGRDEWYSEDVPTEGVWEFVVVVVDQAGNESTAKHEFVVDRTAPVAQFTSGPADGSVVEVGNVSYGWSVTDGLPVTQTCSWDNGEAGACDGTASRGLTAGMHSFKVVLSDQAGNETLLARTVSVKKDGDTPPPDPDPDPDPVPDTSDKVAPVVKMIAPKQTVRSLRKALRLRVRCSEACAGRIVVKGRGLKFAGRVALAKAGVAKLKLRPTARVRKRLLNKKLPLKSLRLTARASLRDKAGNSGKATLKFRVAR